MTHASLFTGIGACELAARRMGWENLFNCEIDPFCNRVLEYHYPNERHYGDIRNTDFGEWGGRVDVLTGGFPCQPFSCAGGRKGTDDDRYLWPAMLGVIRQVRPGWVVGENVAGILSMVFPGEETEVGGGETLFGEGYDLRELRQRYVADSVCEDLEHEGYTVVPVVVPACAVGAPHRRDRVWFVAHRDDAGYEGVRGWQDALHALGASSPAAIPAERVPALPQDWWRDFPTQSPVCVGTDELSSRLLGITFPKWRQEAIKALGNSMCVAVVYELFLAIQYVEDISMVEYIPWEDWLKERVAVEEMAYGE